MVLWFVCGFLAAAVIALSWKLCAVRRSADDLREQLSRWLADDTNILLRISGRDRAMRKLAAELNRQLVELRKARLQYRNGNQELHEAITNISHDLRTPLTAICGYLELLEQEEKSAAAERYLGVIQERAEALKQLTEELFRYSVILSTQECKEEPVDLKAALEESLAAFYTALTERGITPNILLPEEKVVRLLDRSALSRVFSNLLQNAIRYSDGDLSVVLTAEGEIGFSNSAAALNEVQVGRLFDRFYRADPSRNAATGGFGIGLSIARGIAEAHKGSICARMVGEEVEFAAELR